MSATTGTPFDVGDSVVYFSHGVGKITDIEKVERNGLCSMLYVIHFIQDKMVLKVPINSPSIRPICSRERIDQALSVIGQRARRNAMLWSKKMAIYESKVNSGDPIALAEVIRDIYRNIQTSDYSFTERTVFENAMKRIAAELSCIDSTTIEEATEKIRSLLEAAVCDA